MLSNLKDTNEIETTLPAPKKHTIYLRREYLEDLETRYNVKAKFWGHNSYGFATEYSHILR